jgi:hypothetical protein
VSQEFDVADADAATVLRTLADAGFVATVRESAEAGRRVVGADRHLYVPAAAVSQIGEAHHRVAIAVVEAAGVPYTLGHASATLQYSLDPTYAVAAVVQAESAEAKRQLVSGDHEGTVDDAQFRGTAFAFRDPSRFITARHCVDGASASDLVLSVRHAPRCIAVRGVQIHDTADLAVLDLGSDVWPPAAPFMGVRSLTGLGTTVSAYGLPEDAPPQGDAARGPTPRLFRGHVQRFIDYQSQVIRGARYLAAELSFAVPVGLSGGPCYVYGERLQDVYAVAVENIRSATYSGETETIVHSGDRTETIRERDVVSYGIALVLWPLVGWLDEVCPITARAAPAETE